MSEEKKYLSVTQLAAVAGCSRKHIYFELWAGRLPHLRVGKAIRFDLRAVEQALYRGPQRKAAA